jgi:SAM-dependent methyltransferase
VLENFNEFRLFMEHKKNIEGHEFVEIGCATGEMYRYLHRFHPEFTYWGFDVSEPAIERARQKYPYGRFDICKPDLSDLIVANIRPAVVWARDVLHHQLDPFASLARLVQISNEVTILRIRTRDKGATVLDPELSCQCHYNHWVPYIIMNIDETVDKICKAIPVRNIFILKRYVQLGGWHSRFLPKECYYPETGTAETSLYIRRSKDVGESPEIAVSSREDSDYVPPLMLRGIDYLRQKLSS